MKSEARKGRTVAVRCCPRQGFFDETRKRDDGDAVAHRRGALTKYSAEKIGAAAGVDHE
jgi:hypothetical protein